MIVLKIWAVFYAFLFMWAFSDSLWGWNGLFFYHAEAELGHMLCYLGTRYDIRVFGRHFSWVGK